MNKYWYEPNLVSIVLLPLSWLFCVVVLVRRMLYRIGIIKTVKLPVPVIVVGNITVGGTGKTPLVAHIVEYLSDRGYKPGIVSRGYGGRSKLWPQAVNSDSDPVLVGDEAVLLAQRCHCPVVVGPDRPRAAKVLLDRYACDVIISDDGLQHYALHRDIEIVVIDGVRRFGNRRCLPAGPLREPVRRINSVAYVVANGQAMGNEFAMTLRMQTARNVKDPDLTMNLQEFGDKSVHALAGIGNPHRFFAQLNSMGIQCIEHEFKDHYAYSPEDIYFGDSTPVLMTEKDAVKCRRFAQAHHWYVPVTARIDGDFLEKIAKKMRSLNG